MKKIFYYLMGAVVAFGAMACQNDIDENVTPGEGGNGEKVSFVAEIGDVTRVAIGDKEDGKYRITLDENDVLIAQYYKSDTEEWSTAYTFETTDGKNFSCETPGVSELIGKQVTINNRAVTSFCSLCGVDGFQLRANVASFGDNSNITLEVAHAVLMFESEYDVTFNTTTDGFFSIGMDCPNKQPDDNQNSITIPASEGVHYIAVNGGKEADLSYSIDDVECKEITTTFEGGKLYNLGTLEKPSAWSVVGGFQDWDAANGVKMYMEGDYFVARNVANLNGGFKFVKDASWDVSKGAKTGSARIGNRWYKVGDNNITLTDADKYDLYLHKDLEKYVIVEAGSALPEENYDYKVYMLNTINWATTNLYCWYNEDNKDTQCTGEWPGTASTTKVTFGEYEYVAFTPTGAADKYIKVIFNNGSAQTKDLSTSEIFDRDMFFEVHSKSAGKPARYIVNPESPAKAKSYTIKVKNENSWAGLNIHYWDSVAESSWPGVAMTLEGDRYVYTFGSEFDGESVDMLFNYNGDANKTNDLTDIALTCDRYFTIKKDSKEVWWE